MKLPDRSGSRRYSPATDAQRALRVRQHLCVASAVSVGPLHTGVDAQLTKAPHLLRAAAVPALIAAAVANIVAGTITVAKIVLSGEGPRHSGFVVIPQGDRTHAGVVVSAWLDALSPGTVLVEIDEEARTWTIHALDTSDPDEMRAELEHLYQRFQRPVVP